MADDKYPYRNFRFKVTIETDPKIELGFSEVSGYDASIAVVEYRAGDHATTPMKMPGLAKYGNITLKRGVTDSMDLFNWIQACIDGKITRNTVTITAIDESGADKASWTVTAAWPCKYTAPNFNGNGGEVAIESLELAHEGMKRTK
ncbi:phage tail protein [Heliobacterium gestii]|uniref:Phage tail protein n=1 Tax=Heliomicrobium gestii TaxID=2699 RepID=A0A845LFX0_HELGE|nr:phage tail protein [Heliomicrobium gestii]MBM7868048.1 phage tail-like protein [Heliomicrobium gestii]MZP44314.1 phage tail protein [Heliomicrobium gestii]